MLLYLIFYFSYFLLVLFFLLGIFGFPSYYMMSIEPTSYLFFMFEKIYCFVCVTSHGFLMMFYFITLVASGFSNFYSTKYVTCSCSVVFNNYFFNCFNFYVIFIIIFSMEFFIIILFFLIFNNFYLFILFLFQFFYIVVVFTTFIFTND